MSVVLRIGLGFARMSALLAVVVLPVLALSYVVGIWAVGFWPLVWLAYEFGGDLDGDE